MSFHCDTPHAKEVQAVLSALDSHENGLSLPTAHQRRTTDHIEQPESRIDTITSLAKEFFKQFTEPLILLLFASAGVSFLIGQFDDAICITLAIFLVCTVSFVQEYKSERTLDALREFVVHTCCVIREAQPQAIRTEALAQGDIVALSTGDRVPADVRLFATNGLAIDESVLTGESMAVDKSGDVVLPERAELHERENMAFMGTMVVAGNGKGIVVEQGSRTEFGRIAEMIEDDDKQTPLQRSMNDLGKQLSIISIVVIVVIVVFGAFLGKGFLEMFTVGVSLAVAAIPEGLPVVTTVTLAIGCQRMAKRSALIRRLPAVESLGAASVICVDKTGTLTCNEMAVRSVYDGDDWIDLFSGISNGNARPVASVTAPVRDVLEGALLCSNATAEQGSATEKAIAKANATLSLPDRRKQTERLVEYPFTSKTKIMVVHVLKEDGQKEYFCKGAPEMVLNACSVSPHTRDRVMRAVEVAAGSGQRVLAIAAGPKSDRFTDFLGLIALTDPPRPGVADAIDQCRHQSGIAVTMITGDARETAVSIARELGIVDAGEMEGGVAMSGEELEQSSVEDLARMVDQCHIFYRVTPAHKRKIVAAYQMRGHVVAMTGDGINDSPALKLADVGVAMGSGQDVAKEAAEVVLVDDNFLSILSAIEEGRSIYNNIRNFLRFQLTTSVAAMAIIALCTSFGLPMPLNPMQILLINIIMDGPPAQSLGLESSEEAVMRVPPRDPRQPVVSREILIGIVTSAIYMIIATITVFYLYLTPKAIAGDESELKLASTIAFATFVLLQAFSALNCRSIEKSVTTMTMQSNPFFVYAVGGSVIGQILVTHVPALAYTFETTPMSFSQWVLAAAIGLGVVIVDELRKGYYRVQSGTRTRVSRGGLYAAV